MQNFVFFAQGRRIEIPARSLSHAMRIFNAGIKPRRRIGRQAIALAIAGLLLVASVASVAEPPDWWALPFAKIIAAD
jgi:hypothetical protein